MAPDGTLYFTDLANEALKKRAPDGTITTVVQYPGLHWADAPALAGGFIWLPVPQLDRLPLFHKGTSKVAWPIRVCTENLVRVDDVTDSAKLAG
ncbi:hypothetical protein I6F35_15850 [Bradyrhizobium sp. BRP22]|uniref:hypothetical protein n=1 Tax=Bradyrhizobium sp. BRP22 TaxID=2793821 RepID=UPI001CD70C17|nr:hypothetical protein [Bradyrhizobium sp. BRP22]MCA1454684.1 hypothetical protein [Bradyrhizobium sp. BRP22]